MIDCLEEGERLRRLAELAIVEAPVDPLLERLCSLACSLLAMPMAFVSVLDESRTHIKAQHGLAYVSVPRGETFCDQAIRSDEPMIVPDLASDPRFATNAFVVEDPHFRFYAGIPLVVAPGMRIGALCVGDRVPRDLAREQVDCLQTLAGLVLGQIRHHASRTTLARQAIELARKQKILTQTARLAGVGGFEIEPATGELTASDELCRLLGRDTVSTLDGLLSRFEPDGREMLQESFARLQGGEGDLDAEIAMAAADGAARHVRVHAEMTTTPTGCRIIGIVQDVTERRKATSELEWLATHDALTRVCNRAAFTDRVEAAIRRADATGRRVALILLDVDRFKTINDTLGHDAGDRVLVAVADRLVAAIGYRGAVARLGGDEFGVLVDDVEAESAIAAVAGDILAALRKPYGHEGHDVSTRATLGVALSALDASCAASLFKDADIALYEAKKAGRDGFALFRAEMRAALETRIGRLAAARRLLADDRIEPWYQPQVDLATGAIVGVEALLRCDDPRQGLLGPGAFAEAFLDPDLASAIGETMRSRVAADIASWRDRGIAIGRVALNVADAELHAGHFADRLLAWLARHRLEPATIELEVTESLLVGQRGHGAAAALRRLSEAGIAIALDDFGVGLASLSLLRSLPIDRVKIDGSLVRDVATSAETAAVVGSIASLARGLGLAVVAEGIETRAQLEALQARACGLGQGFFFARPMPGARVPHFVRNWVEPQADRSPRAAVGRRSAMS